MPPCDIQNWLQVLSLTQLRSLSVSHFDCLEAQTAFTNLCNLTVRASSLEPEVAQAVVLPEGFIMLLLWRLMPCRRPPTLCLLAALVATCLQPATAPSLAGQPETPSNIIHIRFPLKSGTRSLRDMPWTSCGAQLVQPGLQAFKLSALNCLVLEVWLHVRAQTTGSIVSRTLLQATCHGSSSPLQAHE